MSVVCINAPCERALPRESAAAALDLPRFCRTRHVADGSAVFLVESAAAAAMHCLLTSEFAMFAGWVGGAATDSV